MAKKQTRRSISVSRTTYERLKAFCEANNVSMSQFVETRVGDFLGEGEGDSRPTVVVTDVRPTAPRAAVPPSQPATPRPVATAPTALPHVASVASTSRPEPRPPAAQPTAQVPMTSAAARFAVEPPPPVIKQKPQEAAPKPAEKRPDQIFTF
jgi:hypothetical protein